MMQCTVISVGSLKEDYLSAAVTEYKKRLAAFARVEEINIKEERLSDDSPSMVEKALSVEGERILSRIPEGAYTVALCVEGKMLSSEALAALVGKAKDEKGKLCFIIGSSHGLAPTVKAKADFRLSLSPMTFPHQLMRVILSEALYRSFTILAGKTYHK